MGFQKPIIIQKSFCKAMQNCQYFNLTKMTIIKNKSLSPMFSIISLKRGRYLNSPQTAFDFCEYFIVLILFTLTQTRKSPWVPGGPR